MKTQTKHTATPYRIEKMEGQVTRIVVSQSHEAHDAISGRKFIDNSPKIIARVGTFNDEGKANAEFIVKACNSHDALVEACKEALAYAKMHDCMSMEPLQKALKLAEGK